MKKYKPSYFHRADAVATFLRSNGVAIYILGIGPQSPVDPKIDPYENITNDFNRKNGYLTSLANDLTQAEQTLKDPNGNYIGLNYSGVKTWASRNEDEKKGIERDGMYIGGYSSTGVGQMFERVAKKIQLRFVK